MDYEQRAAKATIPSDPQCRYTEEACGQEARLIEEFAWATSDLEGIVEEYAKRLAPVSRPYYPDTVDSVPQEATSAGRAQLHRINALCGALRLGLDLLEV